MTDYDPEQQPPPQNQPTQQQQATITYDDNLYDAPPSVVQDVAKEQIPQGCTKVFKLAWWEQFFESGTVDVAKRVLQGLIIFKGNFIVDANINKPDLWYPIWVVITLEFASIFTQIICSIVENKSNSEEIKAIGIFSGSIIIYTIVIPTILFFVCWCLDMEGMSYLAILDLITYSYTILVPVMVIYPIFNIFSMTFGWLKTVMIVVFSVCAAWSELFVVYHGFKYVKSFSGTKCQILAIELTIMLLHAAFLIMLGCLTFLQ